MTHATNTGRGMSSRPRRIPLPAVTFPENWTTLFDESVPAYVKKRYSPNPSWRDKPFCADDVRFFFGGIRELSDMFTFGRSDRPARRMIQYFNHPRFRSAYLLYFLPLQAAKFTALFQIHLEAFNAALKHGERMGVLKIADIGAGPGTASIAFLQMFMRTAGAGSVIRKIELEWFDENKDILDDGKTLVDSLAAGLASRGISLEIKSVVAPWWKAARLMSDDVSLVMMGNIMNELSDGGGGNRERTMAPFTRFLEKAGGGGILMVEPAAPESAQFLSALRDELFESELINRDPVRIHGPCLHAGACPLGEGRDWCHFSVPVTIPGKFFRQFSEKLGSERQWVKFSYLWLASKKMPAGARNPSLRRVVSDPLRGRVPEVLLCEPGKCRRLSGPSSAHLHRGDLVGL